MGKFQAGLYGELSLYVRHSAWLHAAPKRPEKSKDAPVSRLKKMRQDRKDETYMPDMPPLEGGEHLIGYLWEVGPVMPAGMGNSAVTHQEIVAWEKLTGIDLQAWEARWLRALSGEYMAAHHAAQEPTAPAPWNPQASPEQLNTVAQSMRERLRKRAGVQ